VWDCQSGQFSQSKSFVEKKPALNMTNTDWLGTTFWYNQTIVVDAWDQLVKSALIEHHANVPKSFKFDLVDTTREVLLAVVIPALHQSLVDGYEAKDLKKIKTYGRQIVSLIQDADRLLNTNPLFSFGAWVRDARRSLNPVGNNKQVTFAKHSGPNGPTLAGYQQFLESNARDLVTWWGPEGTGPPGALPDYASKQWGGLLTSYYLPRWTLFIAQLEEAAATNTPWDREDYLVKDLAREAKWQAEVWGRRPGETWETNGQESVEVVRELWNKWRGLAIKVAAGGKA
jgi:alpha-N-acetylglucosaminidase